MGNDGGSIARRREMVKQKKREQKVEKDTLAKAKANYCTLSNEPLKQPIVACKLGNLYNKEEIIKRLIEKTMPKSFRHIQKLKDVKEAKVEMKDNQDQTKTIVCPVSQIEFNGFNRFVIVWPCGCIMSEEAVKELKMDNKCLSCGITIDKDQDIISLNQTPEEQLAYLHIIDQQQKEQQDKKQKKKDKKNNKRTEREDNNEIEEEEKVDSNKRSKLVDGQQDEITQKLRQSEVYKSIFKPQFDGQKIEQDYLCRGLR